MANETHPRVEVDARFHLLHDLLVLRRRGLASRGPVAAAVAAVAAAALEHALTIDADQQGEERPLPPWIAGEVRRLS